MGNRAVITTNEGLNGRKGRLKYRSDKLGIYLHWNGGRDSVEGFLEYFKRKGYPNPVTDNYGWARMCQVIGNFLGGKSSIGIDVLSRLDCDNGENGVYVIDENWNIVDRYYFKGAEQRLYDLEEFLASIDASQPVRRL